MQALKDLEDAVEILLVKPNAVVCYRNLTELRAWRMSSLVPGRAGPAVTRDPDDRCFRGAAEFEGIANKVLEQLPHLCWIGVDRWQIAYLYSAVGLFKAHFQISHHLMRYLGQRDRYEGCCLGRHP
jgi:hypothetical protein